MLNELQLFPQSLMPTDADWAEFESRFLGKTADCPLTADLIALAQEQAGADVDARVRSHLRTCEYCRKWLEAYREGLNAPEDDLGSLPEAGHPA